MLNCPVQIANPALQVPRDSYLGPEGLGASGIAPNINDFKDVIDLIDVPLIDLILLPIAMISPGRYGCGADRTSWSHDRLALFRQLHLSLVF